MCGKFTQMMSWGELVYHADLLQSDAGAALTITPMRFACVIRMNDKGRREVARMRWGLVPPWEKDPIARHQAHPCPSRNHRHQAFLQGRFPAPARPRGCPHLQRRRGDHTNQNASARSHSQGRQAARNCRHMGALGGTEFWRSSFSFAMVTVSPNKLIATITDRMPAIIKEPEWAKWLGEEPATTEELKALLMPYEGDLEMKPQEKAANTRAKPRKTDTEPKLL